MAVSIDVRPLTPTIGAEVVGVDVSTDLDDPAVVALHCRVRWEPGTLTIWDNLACQHHAVRDDRPEVREGERVTIAGRARPVASSGATT